MLERVIDRKNCASRISEDGLHTFPLQRGPQNLCTGHLVISRRLHLRLHGCCCAHSILYTVTAPAEAEETVLAYLAKTPVAKRGLGACQLRRRSSISESDISTESWRLSTSKTTMSPSRTAAIGPRQSASGATCPAISPRVAPEKRPSVCKATDSPMPPPVTAAVTANISLIPGPPRGPSLRITNTSFGRILFS